MNSQNFNSHDAIVLKFSPLAERNVGEIKSLTGYVRARDLIPLITSQDLMANPREAGKGRITEDIRESIRTSPDEFPFRSKGLLLGASQYEMLERGRVRVVFGKEDLEGILDGGHNTLSIGLHILSLVMEEKVVQKISNWSQFKEVWDNSLELIDDYQVETRDNQELDQAQALTFLVPVELLVPKNPEHEISIEKFSSAIFDICQARNNNAELQNFTKVDKAGYFDELKKLLDPVLADEIEWKANAGGRIKAQEIVSLAWIPLSVISPSIKDKDGKVVDLTSPNKFYSGKGDLLKRFDRLMESPEVTIKHSGRPAELRNSSVLSAFRITKDLPKIYDYIYEEFPGLYNTNGGSYGRISAVKSVQRKVKATPFFQKTVNYNNPDGFIAPLMFGVRALISQDETGLLGWKTDPMNFLRKNLPEIVKQYTLFFQSNEWDPQKIGKANQSYDIVLNAFTMQLLREGIQ